MNEQEVKELVEKILDKKSKGEHLELWELTVLDVHGGLQKQGKQISARSIEEIQFMMD